MAINREHVVWAYRLFLNREPESEEVIQLKLAAYNSVEDLRRDFASSTEFQNALGALALGNATNIVIKEIGNGLRLFVDLADTFIGRKVADGTYEPDERGFIEKTLAAGDVAVDVGANIGYFTTLMAGKVGPAGHVYAFEPLPRNAALLARSIEENRFKSRISFHRAAVGAESGELQLISPRTSLNWGGAYLRLKNSSIPADHEAIAVGVVALDEIDLRRPVKFIKIDAEGAELLGLRGARRVLSEDRPLVLAEINPRQLRTVSQSSPNDLIEYMTQQGYRCHLFTPDERAEQIDRYDRSEIINVVFKPTKDS